MIMIMAMEMVTLPVTEMVMEMAIAVPMVTAMVMDIVKVMAKTAMKNTLILNISNLKQTFIQGSNKVNLRMCICHLKRHIPLTKRATRRWVREDIKQIFMGNNNLNMVLISKLLCKNHIKAQQAWDMVSLINPRWEQTHNSQTSMKSQ